MSGCPAVRSVSRALVLLFCFFAATASAQDPVRIGSFLALTGPASYLGQPELKTLQLYIDRLNAEGGVLGRPLELAYYDTGGSAGKARQAVRQLIAQDKVDILIGGTTSGASMAVIPLVTRAQIPFISLAGATAIIAPTRRWIFKTPHTDRMAVAKVFNDMHSRGIRRIALISGRGGFGRSGRRQALEQAAGYEIEIVADESYGPVDLQIDRQRRKIFSTEYLDAIFNIGFGEGPAMVTRELRRNHPGIRLYQSHGVASKRYIELAGHAAEGVLLPAAALLVVDQLPADSYQRTLLIDYQRRYWQRYGEPVSTFGGHAWDALMLAVQAIRDAQTLNPFAVRDALERVRGFVGTGGVVNMHSKDHLGLGVDAFKMLEIRRGQWTLAE